MSKKVFICICLIMMLIVGYCKYFQWRDTYYLQQESVIEEVHTFNSVS